MCNYKSYHLLPTKNQASDMHAFLYMFNIFSPIYVWILRQQSHCQQERAIILCAPDETHWKMLLKNHLHYTKGCQICHHYSKRNIKTPSYWPLLWSVSPTNRPIPPSTPSPPHPTPNPNPQPPPPTPTPNPHPQPPPPTPTPNPQPQPPPPTPTPPHHHHNPHPQPNTQPQKRAELRKTFLLRHALLWAAKEFYCWYLPHRPMLFLVMAGVMVQ